MSPIQTLGLIAAWFLFGMARMVCTSKLAEHRIDNPDPAKVMSMNSQARSERLDQANYDASGRRLLPWYRAINVAYWTIAAGALALAVAV